MLSKSQARGFFMGGTAFFSAIFIFLTIDTLREIPARQNSDLLTESVVRGSAPSSRTATPASGPALRHATDRLTAEAADRHLLLLVSDGKPTDYDRYEGAYGMADVRQALREAERRRVCTHALAVDAVARDTLPAMFGSGAWHVLPHPGHLPLVLTTVYGTLTAR